MPRPGPAEAGDRQPAVRPWRRALRALGRLGLFVLAFGCTGGLAVLPLATVPAEWAEAFPLRAQLVGDVGIALALLTATWAMTRFVDRRPFRTIGFASGHVLRDVCAGLALGAVWLAASVGAAWALGWARPQALEGFSPALVPLAAASALFNVLAQQLLLCGYILQTIRSAAGFPAAVVVSSALFSLYHAGAFQGAWLPALNVFAAGVLFCLAYRITGNLWLPWAMHFAWNLLLGPVLGLTVSGTGELGLGWSLFTFDGPALFTGGGFGLEGGLVVTATTAILVVVLARLKRGAPAGAA